MFIALAIDFIERRYFDGTGRLSPVFHTGAPSALRWAGGERRRAAPFVAPYASYNGVS